MYDCLPGKKQLYRSSCFFSILTNRNKLTSITHSASKVIGPPTPNLSDLNHRILTHRTLTTSNDPTHPLNPLCSLLPSGRRYRSLTWKRACFKKSFVPISCGSSQQTVTLAVMYCMCHEGGAFLSFHYMFINVCIHLPMYVSCHCLLSTLAT